MTVRSCVTNLIVTEQLEDLFRDVVVEKSCPHDQQQQAAFMAPPLPTEVGNFLHRFVTTLPPLHLTPNEQGPHLPPLPLPPHFRYVTVVYLIVSLRDSNFIV